MSNIYGESAYNSQQVKRQPQPQAKGLWQRLINNGSRFSLNRLSNNRVTSLMSDALPSQWPDIEQDIKNNLPPWWTPQRLVQHKFNGWAQVYMYACAFSQVSCLFFFPLAILTSFIMYFLYEQVTIFNALDYLLLTIQFFFLPAALLWGSLVLVNKGYITPWFIKVQKNFELNRQTGMVTLYKGFNRVRFCHPFIEFDCVLASAPSHQGILSYNLYLIHRYNDYNHGVLVSDLLAGTPKNDETIVCGT